MSRNERNLNEAGKPVQPGTEFEDDDPIPVKDEDEQNAIWAEAITDPDEIAKLVDGT